MQKSLMYLKSSISISAYAGCTINCKYCILSTYRKNNHIEKIISEEELCNNLFSSKYFIFNKTVISINNISDPFLNKYLKQSTFKILDLLEKQNIKNPILLITKSYLTKSDLEYLNSKKLNICILYTFSGLSEKYENRSLILQTKTMELLSKCNKKIICYWRPVIEGINSSPEIINETANIVCKYFNYFVVSGIRINSYLKNVFKNENIVVDIFPNTEHKVIKEETFNNIFLTIKKFNSKACIFKKTSCAISALFNIPDYNAHYDMNDNMCFNCINRFICSNNSKLSISDLKRLLVSINCNSDFYVNKNVIEYDGELSQEDCSFILHNSGYRINAKKIYKSNMEDVLSK